MRKTNCNRCGKIHNNIKYNLCNKCLGRKKCYSPKCKQQINKNFNYCFKCNEAFKPQGEELPKGIYLIDDE